MRLHNEPFDLIKDGQKTIEARLNDEKRKLLQVGDVVEFVNRETDERIKVGIVGLLPYDTFEELFDSCDVSEFGGGDKKNLLDNVYKYYSKDQENKYGVLGIKFELV